MTHNVENRLEELMNLIRLKVDTYLAMCEKPIEKMFLLNYFEYVFDSMTGDWFYHSFDAETNKPFFQYPGNEEFGKYFPEGIKWLEPHNIKAKKAIEAHLFELHPKFEIIDESGVKKIKVDFALFYPRTDEVPVKIKVAIDCVSQDLQLMSKAQRRAIEERNEFLRERGWIVARFTGDKIVNSDVYDLIIEVESLALKRDEELFNETERHKGKWHLN